MSPRGVIGAFAAIPAVAIVLAGCGGDNRGSAAGEAGVSARGHPIPAAPAVPDGPLDPEVGAAVDELVDPGTAGGLDREALERVAASRDARLGWLLSDLLRFTQDGAEEGALVSAFEVMSEVDADADPGFDESPWRTVTDYLIAWDLPAPPAYRERKAMLFETIEPAWKPFFADADSKVDWRLISWGGVFIDDRREGDAKPCPRGCIPALDDPELTPASEGDWYPDERTVFGVVLGGEAVALPKNIMEVHEMLNITIDGRRLGIPYCTLCGSAQAYLLDAVPRGTKTPVLRTSGLLSRSNKVMYDLRSRSVFDTFTGDALSGSLADRGVKLRQTSVVASSWGEWKRKHPKTKIVARDGGIGRNYPLDPLGGRDDEGPIFPVGDVDPRLPIQANVVGVIAPGGKPVAFPVEQSLEALESGDRVAVGGVEALTEGDGLRVRTASGKRLAAHQAFWFAWSQFHPDTMLWTPSQR